MMKKIICFASFLSIVLCFHQSCQTDSEPICEVSFSQDLLPLLHTHCTGYCHASIDHYTEYINLKEAADKGLLKENVVILKTMPQVIPTIDGPEFTDDHRAMFDCWIESGALNN